MHNKKEKISQYINAKDSNKPHFMKDVFLNDSILDIKHDSKNISFPSQTIGLENITKTLINDFNKTYENVYTFCLKDSLKENDNTLECKWVVVMSQKDTFTPRVGYGSYIWDFDKDGLVKNLNIEIEQMSLLEEKVYEKLFASIATLSYPWCESRDIVGIDLLDLKDKLI